jgi:hypothetical protein
VVKVLALPHCPRPSQAPINLCCTEGFPRVQDLVESVIADW